MTTSRRLLTLSLIATVFALCVVMLGAYTRLKHAGLGCPDWPMCYGQITVPQTPAALSKAHQAYPNATISPAKAWPEMIHRYFAGTLGLLIATLGIASVIRRKRHPEQLILPPLLLIGLVIFQAALGMWTVTWKLLPQVVMGHLLGGMSIASLLWWNSLRNMALSPPNAALPPTLRLVLKTLAVLGTLIVFTQIFLGGWTSANYASVVCPNFPYCHGSFFPQLDFGSAFRFTHPIGANYEGGVLSETAKVTIQMTHRYGAMITASFVLILGFVLTRLARYKKLQNIGWAMLLVIMGQFFLGIANIDSHLALPIAVMHNAGALMTLLCMVTLLHYLFREDPRGHNTL